MKNRLILRIKNLSEDAKLSLMGGTATLSALLAGGGYYHFFGTKSSSVSSTEAVENTDSDVSDVALEEVDFTESDEAIIVDTNLDVLSADDSLSFDDAFAMARSEQGAGGFFEWRGNSYNTYYKEELEAKSDTELDDYFDSIDNSIDPQTYAYRGSDSVITSYAQNTTEVEEVVSSEMQQMDRNDDGIIDAGAVSIEESNLEVSLDEAIAISQEDNADASPAHFVELESFDASTPGDDGIMEMGAQPIAGMADEAGEVIGVMTQMDANDDGIIDFGSTDIAVTAPTSNEGVTGIMNSLDNDDDGIIDFGATDMNGSFDRVSSDGVEGIMNSLDDNDDGIIDFGASNIDGGFATIQNVEDEVVEISGNMNSLDEDDDGIIDFGSSDMNSSSLTD